MDDRSKHCPICGGWIEIDDDGTMACDTCPATWDGDGNLFIGETGELLIEEE
jgi:hypothetical protein